MIRSLHNQDLGSISRIHLAAFPHSALGQLGMEAVSRYYQWQLEYQTDAEAIGIYCDEMLGGFCFAGIFHRALSGFVQKNKKFLLARVLTHPWLLFSSFFRERIILAWHALWPGAIRQATQSDVSPKSFGILAVAVDPRLQGKGLGKQLMEEVEKIAIARGFSHLHLSVDIHNSQAISFYQKLGWQKKLNSQNNWQGAMGKSIDDPNEKQCLKDRNDTNIANQDR